MQESSKFAHVTNRLRTVRSVAQNEHGSGVGLATALPGWVDYSSNIPCSEYLTVNFPTAYDRSVNLVRRLSNSIDDLLKTCDVLAMPTVVVRPRRHVPPGSPLNKYTEAGRECSLIDDARLNADEDPS